MEFPLFDEVMPLVSDILHVVLSRNDGCIVILRGLPGSGKTMFAHELAYLLRRRNIRTEICSADQFLYDHDGVYHWSSGRLDGAHAACYNRFRAADRNGFDCIVVDNTNLGFREFEPYMPLRDSARYHLFFVHFRCEDEARAVALCRRTTHDIAEHVIRRNYNRFALTNREFENNRYYGEQVYVEDRERRV